MERVTVYRFTINGADTETGMDALAPRASTAKAIRQISGATPVVESAQVVDSHCIDRRGFLVEGCAWPEPRPPASEFWPAR